jgi:hypothetical protein
LLLTASTKNKLIPDTEIIVVDTTTPCMFCMYSRIVSTDLKAFFNCVLAILTFLYEYSTLAMIQYKHIFPEDETAVIILSWIPVVLVYEIVSDNTLVIDPVPLKITKMVKSTSNIIQYLFKFKPHARITLLNKAAMYLFLLIIIKHNNYMEKNVYKTSSTVVVSLDSSNIGLNSLAFLSHTKLKIRIKIIQYKSLSSLLSLSKKLIVISFIFSKKHILEKLGIS